MTEQKEPPFPASSPPVRCVLEIFCLVVVVFFAVLFLHPAVFLVFFLIPEAPHILGRLVAEVGVLLDVVGNRTLKGIQNLFVGILAEDFPKGYRQVGNLVVALGNQEAGCRVAGFLAVADAKLVAIVVKANWKGVLILLRPPFSV